MTIRLFNAQCPSMAWPLYLAVAIRPVVRVSRFTTETWINRHGATVDGGKEGDPLEGLFCFGLKPGKRTAGQAGGSVCLGVRVDGPVNDTGQTRANVG